MADAHAAIDIGTNSIHLLVARAHERAKLEILSREKEVVRLGSGSTDLKLLSDDAMDRGIATLRRFKQVAAIWNAEISAVATSAVREAANRTVFIERARAEAGIEVEIISGIEEARLIHLGVLHAVPVFDRVHMLIDIGGGSTEFLVGRRGDVIEARSLKLGAIRLTQRFFQNDKLRPEDVEQCRQYVRAYLSPVVRTTRRHGFEVVVGSSGTIGNLAQIVDARRANGSTRSLNNFEFTREDLDGVVRALVAAKTTRARARIPGIDERRADIIVAGALLLEQAFAEFGIESMIFSEYSLREGVILDPVLHPRADAKRHLADPRRAGIMHLAEMGHAELAHAEHTTALALQLFDGTRDLHRLDDSCREYLEAGGMLADIGLSISHSAHHKHSYYIIRNSEQLTGFTDREIELIAQIARYHRKSDPRGKHSQYAALSKRDRQVVKRLAAILRIAIALDRTHAAIVRSIGSRLDGRNLVIELDVDPEADASLELYTAEERKTLFEETFDARVRFEQAAGALAEATG